MRDERGRFRKGNSGGPGNPTAKRTAELKQAFYDAVKPSDLKAIARKLVALAKAGDVFAAKLDAWKGIAAG